MVSISLCSEGFLSACFVRRFFHQRLSYTGYSLQQTANTYLLQHLLSKAALVTDANTLWMFDSYLHHDPLMDDSSQTPSEVLLLLRHFSKAVLPKHLAQKAKQVQLPAGPTSLF